MQLRSSRKSDLLLDQLNIVSDIASWPIYYISKGSSIGRLKSPQSTLDGHDLFKKIKSIIDRKKTQPLFNEKKNKSQTYQKKKINILPAVRKRQTIESDFLKEEHLKVLRMVPNDKKSSRTLRNTTHPLIKREYKDQICKAGPKNGMVNTIEIQTNFSEDEFNLKFRL